MTPRVEAEFSNGKRLRFEMPSDEAAILYLDKVMESPGALMVLKEVRAYSGSGLELDRWPHDDSSVCG